MASTPGNNLTAASTPDDDPTTASTLEFDPIPITMAGDDPIPATMAGGDPIPTTITGGNPVPTTAAEYHCISFTEPKGPLPNAEDDCISFTVPENDTLPIAIATNHHIPLPIVEDDHVPGSTPEDEPSTASIAEEDRRYHQVMLVGDENDFIPYGLTPQELQRLGPLRSANDGPPANYELIKGPTVIAMSALGHLGYHVVSGTRKRGSDTVVWVLEKILKNPYYDPLESRL